MCVRVYVCVCVCMCVCVCVCVCVCIYIIIHPKHTQNARIAAGIKPDDKNLLAIAKTYGYIPTPYASVFRVLFFFLWQKVLNLLAIAKTYGYTPTRPNASISVFSFSCGFFLLTVVTTGHGTSPSVNAQTLDLENAACILEVVLTRHVWGTDIPL